MPQREFLNRDFVCPSCHVHAQQVWYDMAGVPWNVANFGAAVPINNWALAHCQHCGEISVWKEKGLMYPLVADAPLSNPDMPETILPVFDEARMIAALSPKSAAALLRLCLQMLCIHFKEEGKNINEDIGKLVAKGLPEKISKAMDLVRINGNQAVHPGEIDFKDDPAKVEKMFALVNVIVDTMITQPKSIDALWDEVPPDQKRQVEERNEKYRNRTKK